MRKGLQWAVAFIITLLVGIGVAAATSSYLGGTLNPGGFSFTGNKYKETEYETSTDMEHKTDAIHLYDFSGRSPSRDFVLPSSQGPTAVAGRYGGGYKWSYPNNRAINGSDLGILSESFTIEAWLNPRLLQTSDPTICWAGLPDEANIRRVFVTTNGSLWAQMTTPLVNFYSNATLPVDSWTHVALVYNSEAGQVSWIINGRLDKTSESGYTSGWSGGFKIGGWAEDSSYRWNGLIDEFRIRKAALTPSQVAEDMNRPIEKIVRLTGLAPNSDEAVLSLIGLGTPQRATADGAGNANFDVFHYGGLSEGRFIVYHNDQIFQSGALPLYIGDEYKLTYTSYLTPSLVFVAIAISFPLGTAIAYVIKRRASKKPTKE